MNEHYPTLHQMAPWHKTYPVTRLDWWNIFRGPKIGKTAPDESLVVKSNEPRQSLHRLIDISLQSPWTLDKSPTWDKSGKKLFVLLFDGINHGNTTADSISFAQALEQDYGSFVDAVVISNYYDTHQYDSIDNILWDIDGNCAKKYGASWQSIYVIDSDKNIVWKSCGFMKANLKNYLEIQNQ